MSSAQCPSDLNPSQWEAVTQRNTNLLIVAGPGTGKTHTLIYRIAAIAEELKAKELILAITFTNKAAQEMRERLKKRLISAERVEVGTFHQFALKVLKQYSSEAGLPQDFQIIREEKAEQFSKEIWPDLKNSDRKKILQEISLDKSVNFAQSLSLNAEQYRQYLRAQKFLDFDDLLLELWKLLSSNPQVRAKLQQTFRYIFVDEFQDVNPIQLALLKLLAEGNHLTTIGDPNQAIYGFRGSSVKCFESFKDDFPPAVSLSLSDNYRSTANLLSASGQIMAKAKNVFVPELTAKIYTEGRLTIYEAPTDKAEAEYVVHQIERLIGGTSMFSHDSARVTRNEGGNRTFGDIAVLYRLKSEGIVLKEAFERSGIPFCMSGDKKSTPEDILGDAYVSVPAEAAMEAEKISLMTMHASKGLEFPVVFIVGCEENVLPLNLEGMIADVEEERRLFYVGMTRAKEVLYLLSAKKRRLYGKTYQNAPSPFLADIQEELKEYEHSSAPKKKKKDSDQLSLF